MLKKINRLTKPLILSFKSFSTKYFVLRVGKNNLGKVRVAIVVSKKIDKKAVIRNRIKRILASALYEFSQNSKLSLDLVFIAKKDLLYSQKKEIEKEVKNILTKL